VTSEWLSPKMPRKKKCSLYLTAILNCEFNVFVLLSMHIHDIHASNITRFLKGF
jgi:hypothetical protein